MIGIFCWKCSSLLGGFVKLIINVHGNHVLKMFEIPLRGAKMGGKQWAFGFPTLIKIPTTQHGSTIVSDVMFCASRRSWLFFGGMAGLGGWMKETIDRAKKALVGTAWFDIARQESVPGDSSREVFGMVSLRDPNSKVGKVTSNDRGRKGHFESPEVFLKIHPVLHMGKCILKSYIYIYICVYMYIYDLPRDSGKMSVWSVSQNRSKIPPAFITGCRILMWSSEKSHSKKSLKVVSSASQNMSIFLPFFVQWLFFPLKNTIWLLMFAPRVFFCFRSCKLLGFFKIKWLEESCWHRLSG